MVSIKRFLKIINVQTIVVTAASIGSTFLCHKYDFHADFPLTLIGIAIVFPTVFTIGQAYKRREAALNHYASLKAHGRSIYFAFRDWTSTETKELETELKQNLFDLMRSTREMFNTPVKRMSENEEKVYREFSKLSVTLNKLRTTEISTGEVSRCNQYLSKMLNAFEAVKHIYQYRTPNSLRAFCTTFIYVLPVLYGPYFAYTFKDYSIGLSYVLPALFSVILVGLDNIQDQLEDPFDQIGDDDVFINAEKFVKRLDL